MGKAIFIGLGGAGVYPTGHLKAKMLFEYYQGDAAKMRLECQFIFIDTDDKAINDLNKEYGKRLRGGRDFITYEERVNLGDVNPFQIYCRNSEGSLTKEQQHFISWVDSDAAKDLRNQQLRKGASANRQQGRIAIWDSWDSIATKVNAAMTILGSYQDARDLISADPTFYIMSGTCGGTGSSAFLDTVFIVDRLFREKNNRRDPNIRGVLFMPYWYIDYYKSKKVDATIIENYQCNGFAFFDEMEAVLTDYRFGDGKRFIEAAARKKWIERNERFPLFNIAFCIDSQTERGYSVTQEQMYQNTAELLYYWHLGTAQNSMISQRDNEDKPVARPGDAIPAFATIGYRALRFPEELMEEYFKYRFLYELFEKGLLGEEYGDAVPDEQVRNRHVQETFRKCIARYLFANSREPNIPNMEVNRREKMDNKLAFFGLGRFMREGKDEKMDPNKVANADLLGELISDAESIARQIEDEMKQEFEEMGGTTSLENVLRLVRYGYPEATGTFGSLEDEVEEAILRYGLRYAFTFAGRLDLLCEEQVQKPGSDNDLMDKKEANNRRLKELEGEIAAAQKRCLEVRSGKREEALWELHGKLRERIEKKSENVILEQQIIVLNKLSREENGIIDDYEGGIADLKTHAQRRIDDKEKGLEGAYKIDLPSRFLATTDDVTTTYLPAVVQFVDQGKWVRGRLFDTLYKKIVEQEQVPGGEKPRRYGLAYGEDNTKKGLHAVLWEMLTQTEYSDYAYVANGYTTFFRRAFAQNPPQKSAVEVLSEIEDIAKRYIEARSVKEEEIRRERNKSLLERFNAIEDDKDKKWIIDQFGEVGTQTFCPMEGNEGTIYSVFAGPDEALAVALGYSREDTAKHQFVPDNTKNRLVRIKMLTQQSVRRYPHYYDLQAIYQSVKRARADAEMLFAPHIHKVFNKYGAKQGLSQIAVNPADAQLPHLRQFTSIVLYREMCDMALIDNKLLLERIVDINPAYRGSEKRCSSPIFIGEDENGQRVAKICSKLERAMDGRLQLIEKNFEITSPNARNYWSIWFDMHNHERAFDACDAFDDHFKAHATSEWMPLTSAATEALQKKISQNLEKLAKASPSLEVDNLKRFHNALSNELVEVSNHLLSKLASNTSSGSAPVPGSAPQSDLNMDLTM